MVVNCSEDGCFALIGRGRKKCPDHRGARVSDTHDYDPRFDRAQTVAGAKARYVSDETEYTLADMERDIERLLSGDDYPDATAKQNATRELFRRSAKA